MRISILTMLKSLLLTMCFFSFSFCCAQIKQIKVNGGFLTDSVKIGEQTAFYLSAKYPRSLTILFPDSIHNFAPFEFQTKKYFPTETTDSISTDSTIYYLTTFEIDRAQTLSLPVYVLNEQDCTTYNTIPDTLLITQLIASVPDSVAAPQLPLKANTTYENVRFTFNYLVLLIILGALVVIGIIVWIFFGQRISRYFQARRLIKKHSTFVQTYNDIVRQVQEAFSSNTTESALFLWKKYMEQLEAIPYTKLTTRETLLLHKDETLDHNLKSIDRAIYGSSTNVMDSLQHLRTVADNRFHKKLEEVKHGK